MPSHFTLNPRKYRLLTLKNTIFCLLTSCRITEELLASFIIFRTAGWPLWPYLSVAQQSTYKRFPFYPFVKQRQLNLLIVKYFPNQLSLNYVYQIIIHQTKSEWVREVTRITIYLVENLNTELQFLVCFAIYNFVSSKVQIRCV